MTVMVGIFKDVPRNLPLKFGQNYVSKLFLILTNVVRTNVVWTNLTMTVGNFSRCSYVPTFKVSLKSGQ